MVNFYNRYVGLCAKKGISPSRVALEIGISKVSVSNWKSNRNNPTASNLLKIAEYFGVSVEYLKGETDQKEKPLTNGEELNDGEQELLNLFRKVPEESRPLVLEMIKTALKNL